MFRKKWLGRFPTRNAEELNYHADRETSHTAEFIPQIKTPEEELEDRRQYCMLVKIMFWKECLDTREDKYSGTQKCFEKQQDIFYQCMANKKS